MINIQKDVSLKSYNTFKVDCTAQYFADIHSSQEFKELLETAEWQNQTKRFFLGGGSNILFTKPTFDGLVIRNSILGKEIREAEDGVYVKVGAGENRNNFVVWTLNKGLCGIENLISIPGSVGAAPIQNIGAYGVEVKDVISNVSGVDTHGRRIVLTNEQCAFGYRDSIFKHELKNNFFVTDVTFRLQRYASESYRPLVEYGVIKQELEKKGISTPTPQEMADVVAAIRASKLPDPKDVGTAGSFFKNVILDKQAYELFVQRVYDLDNSRSTDLPAVIGHKAQSNLEPSSDSNIDNRKSKIGSMTYQLGPNEYKIPTGWILDTLGYKGHREGDVGCRPQQALCIVNYAHATGPDVVQFAEKLQKECMEKLGIKIEPEVNFIS